MKENESMNQQDALRNVRLLVNGRPVEVPEGTSRIEAVRKAGFFVPTLCEFASRGHRPGTCRVCLVDVEAPDGSRRVVTSCDTRALEGESIRTATPLVRRKRAEQVLHLFEDHCESCHSCARHGACELQDAARRTGVDLDGTGARRLTRATGRDESAPALVFTPDRCIRCFRCVDVCRSMHGIGAITIEGVGTDVHIGFDGGEWGSSDRCIQCGQCAKVCPTGALNEKSAVGAVLDMLGDPELTTVVQVAPAARFGIRAGGAPEENLEGRLRALFKTLGARYVMDTRWAADVTIMEEAGELARHLEGWMREHDSLEGFPTVFTSCCPAWINHVEKSEPDMRSHLSTTRSPQAIFGALAKTYLPRRTGLDPERIRVVSVMPCTAKKDEMARVELLHEGSDRRDIDAVLTVREIEELRERSGLDWTMLEPVEPDTPLMTEASGAGQLFGATGGVLEAALRTLVHLAGGKLEKRPVFEAVRGMEEIREAAVATPAFGTVRVAVVHTIKAARMITEQVRRGTCPYQFVEVMACRGGCSGGGGMPRSADPDGDAAKRQQKGYAIDDGNALKTSHENPDVVRLYEDFLGHPGSERAESLLHTHYSDRRTTRKAPDIEALRAALTLI